MNYKHYYLQSLLYTLFMAIIFANASGQSVEEGLLINEVYLDTLNQSSSWIEIYNPREDTLILKGMGVSHIRSINLLPPNIIQQGGIKLPPSEYLIICWDRKAFEANWNLGAEIQILECLRFSKINGLIRITSEDNKLEILKDDILFGKPTELIKADNINFLDYSRNNLSFSRTPNGSDSDDCWKDFKQTSPSPGKQNL